MPKHLVERELSAEGPLRTKGTRSSARGKRRSVTVNLMESPVSWLHARGHLCDRLFAAAETLRRDYESAQLSSDVTMRWDPVRTKTTGKARLSPTERQLAAKQRFDCAMQAAGKGLEDILWRVVCAGDGLPASEKALGWPARSGKLVLKLALDRVADFYRI